MVKVLDTPPERVMVVCLVDEISMIIEPAKAMKVDRLHVMNYIKAADPKVPSTVAREKYYQTFLAEFKKEIEKTTIIPEYHVDKPTYIFDVIMGELYRIIEAESIKGSTVFVNLSGGTSEFAAAAYVSSMMHDNITLFSTGMLGEFDEKYYSKLLETKTINGKLVGSSANIRSMFPLTGFNIDKPDINSLMALKVFSKLRKASRTHVTVIHSLIYHNIWPKSTSSEDPRVGTSLEAYLKRDDKNSRVKNEKNYYQRHFIQKWLVEGLIIHDKNDDCFYDLTEDGLNFINIFCPDEVFEVNESKLAQPPARGGRRV